MPALISIGMETFASLYTLLAISYIEIDADEKILVPLSLVALGMVLGAVLLFYAIQRSKIERDNIDLAFRNVVQKIPNLSQSIAPTLKLHNKYPAALEKCTSDAQFLVGLNARESGRNFALSKFDPIGSEEGFDHGYILLSVATDTANSRYLFGCLISSDIEHQETRLLDQKR